MFFLIFTFIRTVEAEARLPKKTKKKRERDREREKKEKRRGGGGASWLLEAIWRSEKKEQKLLSSASALRFSDFHIFLGLACEVARSAGAPGAGLLRSRRRPFLNSRLPPWCHMMPHEKFLVGYSYRLL